MKFGNRRIYFAALALLAVALRWAGIVSRPIWYDEAFSILLSERGPSAILSGTLSADADASAAEEHPPAYYFMLWGWMKIFGTTLPAARALSVLTSLASIFLIYRIARLLFDDNVALVAAFLASILPFQIHYAQEIRMYGLMALWLALTTYAFLKRQWVLFACSAALAQYTHNLAAFYLIPLALTPLVQRDWKTLRALMLSGLAALVLYLPWLIHLPAQFAKVAANFWIEKPGADKFFTLPLFYLPHLPLQGWQLPAGLLLALLVIALAAYQTFRARIHSDERLKGLWTAYLAFFPPLLLWLFSQWKPVYLERALLPSHALFCVWLAWALTRTKFPRALQTLSFGMIIAAAAIGIYQHVLYVGFPYGRFDIINQTLRGQFQTGDVVIHSSKLSYLPAFYFDRNLQQGFILDSAGSGSDTLSPANRRILNLTGYQNVAEASSAANRVWLVIYRESVAEYQSLGNATHPHVAYLQANFAQKDKLEFDDLELYLFVKRAP